MDGQDKERKLSDEKDKERMLSEELDREWKYLEEIEDELATVSNDIEILLDVVLGMEKLASNLLARSKSMVATIKEEN